MSNYGDSLNYNVEKCETINYLDLKNSNCI